MEYNEIIHKFCIVEDAWGDRFGRFGYDDRVPPHIFKCFTFKSLIHIREIILDSDDFRSKVEDIYTIGNFEKLHIVFELNFFLHSVSIDFKEDFYKSTNNEYFKNGAGYDELINCIEGVFKN